MYMMLKRTTKEADKKMKLIYYYYHHKTSFYFKIVTFGKFQLLSSLLLLLLYLTKNLNNYLDDDDDVHDGCDNSQSKSQPGLFSGNMNFRQEHAASNNNDYFLNIRPCNYLSFLSKFPDCYIKIQIKCF